jgi:hypothetical protein
MLGTFIFNRIGTQYLLSSIIARVDSVFSNNNYYFFLCLAAKEKKPSDNRGLCENAPNRARM